LNYHLLYRFWLLFIGASVLVWFLVFDGGNLPSHLVWFDGFIRSFVLPTRLFSAYVALAIRPPRSALFCFSVHIGRVASLLVYATGDDEES
jgi:hypothetical protein